MKGFTPMTKGVYNQSTVQPWLSQISMMQQSVLLSAIRGPDGLPKYGPTKMLLRWFRRCILIAATENRVLTTPAELGGGSFTGPSCKVGLWQSEMDKLVGEYLQQIDSIPHHFHLHFMHAAEILGYKHPVNSIRYWWHKVYLRLVADMHLTAERELDLDRRLSDDRENWLAYSDEATSH